ncbi:MAG: hypothetical protein RL199_1187 [Pseudomonadota bacterium]|jgi:uncharacterized protein YdhG (YjbR/CyaY superfamily)
MAARSPTADAKAVAAYIEAAPEPARTRLRALAAAVREEVPDAIERIAYGLATWHQGENLIHLGAFTHHVGVYPGPAAILAFADDLAGFKSSKGAIQVPHDAPLPTDLVRRLTRWRVDQATSKTANTVSKRRTAARHVAGTAATPSADVTAYNAARSDTDRATCGALADHIATALSDGEGKVWHGHPVWFLAGNPIVGYSTHKESTRLLFWSGQSFDEPALTAVGKFKAAEVRFTCVDAIDPKALLRWLEKARAIQWDYKNIVKNKGVLERLYGPASPPMDVTVTTR